MFKALFKKQLMEVGSGILQNKKTGARRSAVGILGMALIFVLLFASLCSMFFLTAAALCGQLAESGRDWLYFAVMGLMSVTLGVVGSVFTTYNTLYQARDNDLLLAMPIPPGHILFVRLFGVWIWGLYFTAGAMVPALIVYWSTVPVTLGMVLGGLGLLVLLSVLVLALSCILGWVVAKVSSRIKNKTYISVALSLAFIALYFWVYSNAYGMLMSFLQNAEAIGDSIRGYAYPLYLMGRMGTGDLISGLLFTAMTAALFGLVWWVLARSFIRLATARSGGPKAVYREKTQKMRSPAGALLFKETRRFTTSSLYMLNCGLSSVIAPVLGVVALVKAPALRGVVTQLEELAALAPVVISAGLISIGTMNMVSAPSVSLEGKNLWLIQVLPVDPWQVLKAKLHLHLLVTEVPLAFASVCVCIALGFDPVTSLFVMLVPAAMVLFSGAFGLAVDLKMPKLEWTSETVPIKQNVSIMLTMLGNMLLMLLLCAPYLLLWAFVPPAVYLAVCLALVLLLSALLTLWLKKRGTKILAKL